MENNLILLMGVSSSGKSTLLEKYTKDNVFVLSSDKIREEKDLSKTDKSVFSIIEEEMKRIFSENKENTTVIIDATNLSNKRHRRWINVVESLRKSITINVRIFYKITHPSVWEDYAQKRIDTLWTDFTMEDMYKIRSQMYGGLAYPLLVDDISIYGTDVEIDFSKVNNFLEYYKKNKESFVNNPTEIVYKDIFLDAVPEFRDIIGYDQNNQHHSKTLDEHTLEVTSLYEKTEIGVWAALLHDLGKVVTGIRETKEDGYSSYLGHAGASMELSYLILSRLDFDIEFIKEVMKIIGYHMILPYNEMSEKTKNKMILKYGKDLFDNLVEFRNAEISAKTIEWMSIRDRASFFEVILLGIPCG